jgi:hypothetical protein
MEWSLARIFLLFRLLYVRFATERSAIIAACLWNGWAPGTSSRSPPWGADRR